MDDYITGVQAGSNYYYVLKNARNGCSLSTCLLKFSYNLKTSIGSIAFFIAFFPLLLLAQVALGVRHRTWVFALAMSAGLVLEVVGYAGRVVLTKNPWPDDNFAMFLVPLIIAPTFILVATPQSTLLQLITISNIRLTKRLKARTYAIAFATVFAICDITTLILVAIGGARIRSTTPDALLNGRKGVKLLIIALTLQIIPAVAFAALLVHFALKARKHSQSWPIAHTNLRDRRAFYAFLIVLALSTLWILLRTCYRIAELAGSFTVRGAHDQTLFVLLDGLMIALACVTLTVCHPGGVIKGAREMVGTTHTGANVTFVPSAVRAFEEVKEEMIVEEKRVSDADTIVPDDESDKGEMGELMSPEDEKYERGMMVLEK